MASKVPACGRPMQQAGPGEYLFSRGLRPGPVMINAIQISRRWRRVRKKLEINATFYAFKKSNLDEIAAALQKHKDSVKTASEMAGHTTPVITMKHYLEGEQERQNITVQKIQNEF